jgi:hypothetical protein
MTTKSCDVMMFRQITQTGEELRPSPLGPSRGDELKANRTNLPYE